jgi:hypothetical protein
MTQEYSLSDNRTECEQQVDALLLQDKFIFQLREGVCYFVIYLFTV